MVMKFMCVQPVKIKDQADDQTDIIDPPEQLFRISSQIHHDYRPLKILFTDVVARS